MTGMTDISVDRTIRQSRQAKSSIFSGGSLLRFHHGLSILEIKRCVCAESEDGTPQHSRTHEE